MSKFYGPIGFVESEETYPGSGVWEDVAVEHSYRGDIIRNTKRWEIGEKFTADHNFGNQFSIVADPYAMNNIFAIKYLKWLGTYWNVTTVEVQTPRLLLSIGGVYNGPKVEATGGSDEHPRIQ